jgi:hypothetical protein
VTVPFSVHGRRIGTGTERRGREQIWADGNQFDDDGGRDFESEN